MCFSANMSFIAVGVLTITGLISLFISRTKVERAISLTPLFFAAQQAAEGILWLTLPVGNGLITGLATYTYLFFVFIFWPLWMPVVISFYESEWIRKIGMYCCAAAGGCIALYALRTLLFSGAHAQIEGHHIRYIFTIHVTFIISLLLNALYCIATIVPLLICSRPRVWYLGVALAISNVLAYIFYYVAFTSVWCFFGAILSMMTLYIIYYNQKENVIS